jgi:hypothetical protein
LGGSGGAVYVGRAVLVISNSTIAGNQAGQGGHGDGILAERAGVSLIDDSIAYNHQPGEPAVGDGVWAAIDTVTAQDTLFASNGAAGCAGQQPVADVGGHDLDYPDQTCPHDITGNPRLPAPPAFGTPMHVLVPGLHGAALDQVPTADAGCDGVGVDERGVPRPQGPRCDIGAVERIKTELGAAASKVTATSATLNGTFSTEPAGRVLFQYGTAANALTHTTPPVEFGPAVLRRVVSVALHGLAPRTTYYFELVLSTGKTVATPVGHFRTR